MKKHNFIYLILICLTLFSIIISNNYTFFSNTIFSAILLFIIIIIIILNKFEIVTQINSSFIYFMIMTALLLFSILKTDGGFGSVFFILIISLILLLTGKIKIDFKYIVLTFVISTIVFIYQTLSDYSNLNTNDAASQVLVVYLLSITSFNIIYKKSSFQKNYLLLLAINLILIMLSVTASIKYESRSIILSNFAYIAIALLPFEEKIIKKFKHIDFITAVLLSFGSLLFVNVYLYICKTGFDYSFSLVSRKSFDSRLKVWEQLIYLFKEGNVWVGIGSKVGNINGLGAHNYMFSLLILFGVPCFVMFFLILKNYFKLIYANLNKYNKTIFAAIIALFINCFFETTFLNCENLALLLMLGIMYESVEGNKDDKNVTEKKN